MNSTTTPQAEALPRAKNSAANRQIRGSSLMLVGRALSMGVNFVVQVLIVRYFANAKGDYGAFAYALSIVTHILPKPVFLTAATLEFPENRDAPIAASLSFANADKLKVEAVFDWRQTGKQSWDIEAETSGGAMRLADGGARLFIDGKLVHDEPEQEYPELYRRFAALIKAGESDADLAPLTHVADAFMLGQRKFVEAFHD